MKAVELTGHTLFNLDFDHRKTNAIVKTIPDILDTPLCEYVLLLVSTFFKARTRMRCAVVLSKSEQVHKTGEGGVMKHPPWLERIYVWLVRNITRYHFGLGKKSGMNPKLKRNKFGQRVKQPAHAVTAAGPVNKQKKKKKIVNLQGNSLDSRTRSYSCVVSSQLGNNNMHIAKSSLDCSMWHPFEVVLLYSARVCFQGKEVIRLSGQ